MMLEGMSEKDLAAAWGEVSKLFIIIIDRHFEKIQ